MPVKFIPGPRKRHEKETYDVDSVLGSLADFLDPRDDMPAPQGDILEAYTTCNFRDLTSTDDCRPSLF